MQLEISTAVVSVDVKKDTLLTIDDGVARARSYSRFAAPLLHFIPDSRVYSVPLFLKWPCDRTPGAALYHLKCETGADRQALCDLFGQV